MSWLLRIAALGIASAGLVNTIPYRETVHPSSRLFSFLRQEEGLRLAAYNNGDGWTVGYGHASVRPGTVITKERAETLLRTDVGLAYEQIKRLVHVPLTRGQLDAMVALVYNIGPYNLSTSRLLRELNAGHYETTRKEFLRWVHSGGSRKVGLVNRRRREVSFFRGE